MKPASGQVGRHTCTRFLGFCSSTPGILPEFSARLLSLVRVSVSRVACTHAQSPCPRSSFTHARRFLGISTSTPGILPEFSARVTSLRRVSDSRVASTPSPLPSPLVMHDLPPLHLLRARLRPPQAFVFHNTFHVNCYPLECDRSQGSGPPLGHGSLG